MGHDKEDIQSLVSRCLHGNFQDASKTVSNQLNLATEGSGVGQWEPMIALAGGKGRGEGQSGRAKRKPGVDEHRTQLGKTSEGNGEKKIKQCKACCRKRQT